MKRKLIIILAVVMVFALAAGCGIKDKIEQKAGEAIGEKIIEGVAGGNVDVDLDDDTFVIEGEDGEKLEFGSGEWPDSDLAKKLPKYDDGEIDSVFQSEDGAQVSVINTDEKYFAKYLEEVKKDFAENAYEGKSDGSITYSASCPEGDSILIMYENESCKSQSQKAHLSKRNRQ
jgi:hypothetical protein